MILLKKYRIGMFCLLALHPFVQLHSQEELARVSNATPQFAINTNLLSDLTYSLNLGAEWALDNNFTLKMPLTYNPWDLDNIAKYKFLLFQPELRWWSCEPFSGHFFGLHAHYASFNAGGILSGNLKKYRYQGWLAGAGLSYGYQFYLSPRWNLELNVGVGYAYVDYDKYEKCDACWTQREKDGVYHYLGLTQVGISLIYILK
ncbi:MAG: DUF3575 domain-containing protein [Candidatus Symbiothrix sp.]|jgi:hypothetical protein|nr:DUF3575 domain-containing protein [Candidatus Symbiothrix sp.]